MGSRFERGVDGEGAFDIVARSECGWGRAGCESCDSMSGRLDTKPVSIGAGMGRKTCCAARWPCTTFIL